MTLFPFIIGFIAAVIATLPQFAHQYTLNHGHIELWALPGFILLVTCSAMILQKFVLDRRPGSRSYDGVADFLVHIHAPSRADSSTRWAIRGLISFLLSMANGIVGIEGACAEFAHAILMKSRARSARWFEQKRRTDAAVAISAGIGAAFGAPFAAILIPIELSIGGRTISAALAALSAFALSHWIREVFGLSWVEPTFTFHLASPREWLVCLAIAVGAGVLGSMMIALFRALQESLLELFQTQTWIRTLAGGVLLFLVALLVRSSQWGNLGGPEALHILFSMERSNSQIILMGLTQTAALGLALAAFGSAGVFWPVFAIGSSLGLLVGLAMNISPSLAAAAGLIGSAALWGSVLGVPLAGALVAFEISGNPQLILPAVITALLAREIRRKLISHSAIERDLMARDLPLLEGRSSHLMESLFVRDAMVIDHSLVHEHEPISELHGRMIQSKYPFFPVVNAQGIFIGLLTTDQIDEGWKRGADQPVTPLDRILQARDILYKTRRRESHSVRVNDRLAATQGLFEDAPCITVLSDDQRVIGLLFVYNVRLAYDREVAKRSLTIQARDL